MCIGGRLHGRCCRPPILQVHPLPNNRRPIPAPAPVYDPPKPVPLVGVVVSAKVVDFVAEVSIHQRFENVEDLPIEAIYEFPLAEGASVCRFYALVDGKKVEGKMKEKEEAKDIYDDAIAAGNSAYLLEEGEKKNTFKTSIGNIPPKSDVVITIVYVTELVFTDDKKLEFVIPTNTSAYPDGVVVPKFFHSTRSILPPAPTDSKIIVPPYGLKVGVSFDMTSKIKSISSPSHPIEFNAGDTMNTATVSLANQDDVGVPLVKNFEMRISLANPDSPVFRVQDGVGMLALYPNMNADDEDPITEMIFLVDRSGSMSGAKIQRVKDTLHIFLRCLPLGTLFNIVGFGSNYVSLFKDGSKEYDDTTLAEASKHVNDLKANLGGTALLPPLKYIFSQQPREGIPRQIFVLTDGEVDNTQDVIDFVRSQSDTSRVFAFGIHGASPELVNGIAKAGEGKAEIISGNENIEGKVMVQLRRALQPALTDLKVDWGTLKVEQTPFKLPPLFSGSRVIVYAYLAPDSAPGKITFTAQSVKGPFTFDHTVSAEDLLPLSSSSPSSPSSSSDLFIPKLAARSLIRDLEEGRSAAHAKSGGGLSALEAKKKIIDLSIKNGMLSKHTAFIAVNENNTAVESSMQTRDVNKLVTQQAQWKSRGSMPMSQVSVNTGGGMLGGGGGGMRGGGRGGAVMRPAVVAMPRSMPRMSSSNGGGGGGGPGGYGSMSGSISARSGASVGGTRDGGGDRYRTAEDREERSPRMLSKGGVMKKEDSRKDKDKSVKSEKLKKSSSSSSSSSTTKSSAVGVVSYDYADDDDAQESFAASPRRSDMSMNMPSAPPSAPPPAAREEEQMKLPSAAQSGLKDIVMQQKAGGNFPEDALKLCGATLSGLRDKCPAPLKGASAIQEQVRDQILITAFICGVLRTKYKGESDQWLLVEKKGIAWIKKQTKDIPELTSFDWVALGNQLLS